MPSISSVVARPDARRALALAVSAALALPPPLAAQTAAPAGKGNGQATRVLTAPSVKRDDERVTLNFVNADIEQTIRAIGQFSGRQFVIDPRVKGTLTLVTERPVDKRQAYEQLLAALRLQGYTIVEPASAGGVARILPEADAKLQGGRVIGNEQTAPRGDQIVTQVFQLQHESATALVPVLRPLIAPNNTISAYPGNNTLVITDYADNLRRIAQIISAVDQSGLPDADVVPLKYALAVEIAATANKVLDEGARAAGQAVDHAHAKLAGRRDGRAEETATRRRRIVEVAVVRPGQQVEQGRGVANGAGFGELDRHAPEENTGVGPGGRAAA